MLVQIFTTYFANLRKIPEDVIPISISVKPPKGWKGLSYPKLFPTEKMIADYKRSGDERKMMQSYNTEILGKLNPFEVLKDLDKISVEYTEWLTDKDVDHGLKIALVCYEKPGDFCHRRLVARWLKNATEGNLTVDEL